MASELHETTGAHSTPLRERIVEAAARVYGDHGFRGATTRRIAEEAGVNEVTLFRIFGSKAALIAEVMQLNVGRGFEHALPAVPVDPVRELTDWAQAYHRHARHHRGLIMQSMGEIAEHPAVMDPVCTARDREYSALCDYLAALRTHGFATAPFEAMTVASMLSGTIFSDAVGRDLFPATYHPDEHAAVSAYVALILRALGVPAATPPTASAAPTSA